MEAVGEVLATTMSTYRESLGFEHQSVEFEILHDPIYILQCMFTCVRAVAQKFFLSAEVTKWLLMCQNPHLPLVVCAAFFK